MNKLVDFRLSSLTLPVFRQFETSQWVRTFSFLTAAYL